MQNQPQKRELTLYDTFQNLLAKTVVYPIHLSSYKELCSLLGQAELTNPASRTAQIQNIEQYCKLSTQGRKIFIEEIYSKPSIKLRFDSKATMQEALVYSLIEHLKDFAATKEDTIHTITMGRWDLASELGLCDKLFYFHRTRDSLDVQKDLFIQPDSKEVNTIPDLINQFFSVNYTNFYEAIDSMVAYLRKHKLLEVLERYEQRTFAGKWKLGTRDDDIRIKELRMTLQNMNPKQLRGRGLISFFKNMAKQDEKPMEKGFFNDSIVEYTYKFCKKHNLSYFHRPVYELRFTKGLIEAIEVKLQNTRKKVNKLSEDKNETIYTTSRAKIGTIDPNTEEKSRIAWEVLIDYYIRTKIDSDSEETNIDEFLYE